MTCRTFPRFALALALACLASHIATAAPRATYADQLRARKAGCPNLIFILADDLGYGDLGCYGQQRIQTPNLDRLAAEGIRFTQCYAGSTVCAPSRAVLMTGLHTGHARIRGNGRLPLEPEDLTVAEVLQKAGYVTCAVGKWGLGLEDTTGHPNLQGFDEWLGYLDQVHAHNYYTDYLWRGADRLEIAGNRQNRRSVWTHDIFTQSATNFIQAYRNSPFFLYLAYTVPHANNELGRATGNGMEVPGDKPYGAQSWPQVEKNKAAMITRLDTDVGRLLDLLDRLHLATNTVVFFSSDNGPHREGGVDPAFFASAGPLRGIKRDLYEGGIRVPMIVRWKGRIPAGRVSDQVWSFVDFLPTAAELARTPAPARLDGLSVVPTLLGRRQERQPQFLYWEFHERGFHQAARMGNWKAIRHGLDQALELYNLKVDPGETNDVSALHADVVKQIEDYLSRARTDSPQWPVKPVSPEAGRP